MTPLVILALAWLAGLWIASQISLNLWAWLGLAVLCIPGIAIGRDRSRLAFAATLLLMLGAARYTASLPRIDEGHIAWYNDQGFQSFEGWIDGAPDPRDSHTNLRIRVTGRVAADGAVIPSRGWALVQAPRLGTYRYGDLVTVTAELTTPPEFSDFSYRDYLARQGVRSLGRFAQVEISGERAGNPLRAALFDLRTLAGAKIAALLPDPQAALLQGILLGVETGIPEAVRADFNAADATHIIAISGSNMAVVAGLLLAISRRFLSERPAVILSIGGILLYAVFVGAEPAPLRAAIMVALALAAPLLGREAYGPTSLAFAAMLFTLIDPLTLWDLSFQLSFMATLGLLLYVGPMQRWLDAWLTERLPQAQARLAMSLLSDALLVTLAAQITTRPLMLASFGRFSLVGLPVNLLIVPLQPFVILFGGLGTLFSLLFEPLGQLFLWGAWAFLSLTLRIVQAFGGLPWASVEVSAGPGIALALYALIFGLTALLAGPQEDRQARLAWLGTLLPVKSLALAGLLIAGLLFTAAWRQPDRRLTLNFIDVGEGSATLLISPSGRQVLIGAGCSGRNLSGALGEALPFWDQRIDLLILPGADSRAANALPDVLERYRFDLALFIPPAEASENEAGRLALLASTPSLQPQAGQRIEMADGVNIEIMAASEEGIAVLIRYGEARVLLPGELEDEALEQMLRAQGLDMTLLLLPRNGLPDSLLDARRLPQLVLWMDSEGRRQAVEPTLQALDAAGVPIHRADQQGSLRVVIDGGQMWLYPDREP